MNDSQKDFEHVWKELTFNGELYSKEPKRFTPIGIRKNAKENGPNVTVQKFPGIKKIIKLKTLQSSKPLGNFHVQ